MYKLTSLAESVSLETPFVSKLVHLSFNKEESFGRKYNNPVRLVKRIKRQR